MEAPPRVLPQAPGQEPADRIWHRRGQQLPIWFLVDDGGDRVRDGLPSEHWPSGQHLEENASERPDICTFVDRLAAGLFRTHVGSRSQHTSFMRPLDGDGWF